MSVEIDHESVYRDALKTINVRDVVKILHYTLTIYSPDSANCGRSLRKALVDVHGPQLVPVVYALIAHLLFNYKNTLHATAFARCPRLFCCLTSLLVEQPDDQITAISKDLLSLITNTAVLVPLKAAHFRKLGFTGRDYTRYAEIYLPNGAQEKIIRSLREQNIPVVPPSDTKNEVSCDLLTQLLINLISILKTMSLGYGLFYVTPVTIFTDFYLQPPIEHSGDYLFPNLAHKISLHIHAFRNFDLYWNNIPYGAMYCPFPMFVPSIYYSVQLSLSPIEDAQTYIERTIANASMPSIPAVNWNLYVSIASIYCVLKHLVTNQAIIFPDKNACLDKVHWGEVTECFFLMKSLINRYC